MLLHLCLRIVCFSTSSTLKSNVQRFAYAEKYQLTLAKLSHKKLKNCYSLRIHLKQSDSPTTAGLPWPAGWRSHRQQQLHLLSRWHRGLKLPATFPTAIRAGLKLPATLPTAVRSCPKKRAPLLEGLGGGGAQMLLQATWARYKLFHHQEE